MLITSQIMGVAGRVLATRDNLLVRIHFIIVMIRWPGLTRFALAGRVLATREDALRAHAASLRGSAPLPSASSLFLGMQPVRAFSADSLPTPLER